jgi:hypothetical protein
VMTLSRTIKPRLLTLVPLGRVTLGLACIHGVVGEDLGDADLDSLTNADNDLALPGSLLGVVVDLQISKMLTTGVGLRQSLSVPEDREHQDTHVTV